MPIIENIKKQIGQLVKPEAETPSVTSPHAILKRPPLNVRTPDLQSFEGTYKTAYSHGLEAIYALENVDLKSIRRISDAQESEPLQPKSPPRPLQPLEAPEPQLELDLGDGYRSWIESFVLQEPIHVLGVSPMPKNAWRRMARPS